VEQFESARYRRDSYVEEEPVHIPVRKLRRDVEDMDMYPRRREEDFYEDEEGSLHEERRAVPSRPPTYRDERARHLRRKLSLSTVVFSALLALLLTGFVLYTYVFDSATITIVPKYKDAGDMGKPFLFSQGEADPKGIPFVVETTSLSKTKTLVPSEPRKVEAKASGKVTVYNNYDANPQKLIKNTRFESTTGKIYRISQSVEVPGKKGDTPGSLEVTLYADSNGAEYNVDQMTFSIPGFKGTSRESAFYAKSKGAIKGGASGTKSLVSLSDLNAAKDSLALELETEIKAKVLTITKEGYVPMYSALEVTYEDNQDDVLSGLSNEYKVTATGHLMLASGPKIAEALAKTLGDYDGAPVRIANPETLAYTRKQSDKITASGTLSILVVGKPRVVWETDFDAIKDMVKGKDRDEFKPLMKTINSIESAEIDFSPLWLSHFPSEVNKLKIVESLPKR
jgi:hypothetical protein